MIERFRFVPDLHDEPHARMVPDREGDWIRFEDLPTDAKLVFALEQRLFERREEVDALNAGKAKLLSDEILKAFDQDFIDNVWAEDDMPALLDYRRAMAAAIVRAFR